MIASAERLLIFTTWYSRLDPKDPEYIFPLGDFIYPVSEAKYPFEPFMKSDGISLKMPRG